jgi:hypothetical protein
MEVSMAEKQKVNGSESSHRSGGVAETLAAVAVIGIGAALIEVEWIPGILIGIGAMLAPKLIPGLADAMKPVVRTAIRSGYLAAMKTREVVAEAKEQVEDIVAEVRAEQGMGSPMEHSQSNRRSASPN